MSCTSCSSFRSSRPTSADRHSIRKLADIDGKLRNDSFAALNIEDVQLAEFRDRFKALDPTQLAPRHRVDRLVALAEIEFLLHQHEVLRHQERALDSYVDSAFRGVDWQIQGMTPTGATTYGTDAEWQQVIARTRAVRPYLATAEGEIAAGVGIEEHPGLARAGRVRACRARSPMRTTSPRRCRSWPRRTSPRRIATSRLRSCRRRATKRRRLTCTCVIIWSGRSSRRPDPHGRSDLKPEYRADRYALGAKEYDWALRNNLRLKQTSAELYEQSWPIVQQTQARDGYARSRDRQESQVARARGRSRCGSHGVRESKPRRAQERR